MIVGIGTDLVEIDRISKAIQRFEKFSERCFTESERSYCLSSISPAERFAVRFAAKEAVMKALGVGLGAVGFKEIEVVRAETGDPAIVLYGNAVKLAEKLDVETWHVSLTHTKHYAQAFVIAEG